VDGTLYVNNVFSNNLYRIPVDANGELLVAENGTGKAASIPMPR
jgi:hypothetical protein